MRKGGDQGDMNRISGIAVIMPADAVIGENVAIEDGFFIDHHCIIRDIVRFPR